MTNGASIRAVESPFDWVQRSLASALGVSPHDIPIRRDQPITAATDAEIARLAGILKSRYVPVEDPQTGNIVYEVCGQAMVLEPGKARIRGMAERAEIALTPLPGKLRELDLNIPQWKVPASELTGIVEAAASAIDALRLELLGEASPPIIYQLLTELLDDGYGWISRLCDLLEELCSDPPTVEVERQIQIIGIVRESLECLREAWESGCTDGLGERLDYVIRCARHIGEQVRIIRDDLAESGISRCELQEVLIKLPVTETLKEERAHAIWARENCPEGQEKQHWIQAEQELALKPKEITLDDLLRQAEDFASRAPGMAIHGKSLSIALTHLNRRSKDLYAQFAEAEKQDVIGQLKIAEPARATAALNRLRTIVGIFPRLLHTLPKFSGRVQPDYSGTQGKTSAVSPEDSAPM